MKAEEKYKVIENRPELTPEQVRAGMDFQSLTGKISGTEIYFLKTAVLAFVIAASLITGYLLYKFFISQNQEPQNSAEPANIQDTIYRSADTVEMILIDKPDSAIKNKTNPSVDKKKNQISSKAVSPNNHRDTLRTQQARLIEPHTDTIISVTDQAQQSETHADTINMEANKAASKPLEAAYTCMLWKTDDPCTIPDSAANKLTINCTGCEFIYLSCNDLRKKPGKIVWLNIPAKRGRIIMRKNFENITLYSDGKKIHPYAVANVVGDENNRYLSNRFKANYMAVTYQKKIILILVFPDAKVGDRIVINETIDAVIQK